MDPFTLAAIFTVAGGLTGAYGELEQGRYARAMSKIQAMHLRKNAQEAFAGAQRDAADIQLQTDLTASRALAVAAASGAGASDPTVLNIISKISSEGAYHKSMALYKGKMEYQDLQYQAWAAEKSGAQAERASRFNAAGKLLNTGSSLYSNYNPKAANPGGIEGGTH